MKIDSLASSIRKDLRKLGDAKRKKDNEKYFKEGIKTYGVKVPDARGVAGKYLSQTKNMGLNDRIRLAEKLLRDGVFEEGIVAFEIVWKAKRYYTKDTFRVFERWLDRYVKNWAHCDELSNHLFGYLIEKYPELAARMVPWTKSKNRWKRRSAAVSFILPARKGKNTKEIFDISEKLMDDKDYMVQKGVGWLLKEESKSNKKKVIDFLMKWKGKTSGLIVSYATEKMPEIRPKLRGK